MKVNIKLLNGGKLPEYKRDGDVCLDCYANENICIKKGERKLVSLGFAIELPLNWEAIIRPRSGNSKNGIDIAIGTIDTNYRGELKANVINNSAADFEIKARDRICQLAIREAPKTEWNVVDELSDTVRGENGFGSSGV